MDSNLSQFGWHISQVSEYTAYLCWSKSGKQWSLNALKKRAAIPWKILKMKSPNPWEKPVSMYPFRMRILIVIPFLQHVLLKNHSYLCSHFVIGCDYVKVTRGTLMPQARGYRRDTHSTPPPGSSWASFWGNLLGFALLCPWAAMTRSTRTHLHAARCSDDGGWRETQAQTQLGRSRLCSGVAMCACPCFVRVIPGGLACIKRSIS